MKILFLFLVISIFVAKQLYSQSYFQQEVNNKINVTLNDIDKTLKGDIEIEYINNSPTTLEHIYINLFANSYSSKESALAKQQITILRDASFHKTINNNGYIDSLDFYVNNTNAIFNLTTIDFGILILPKPLLPEDTIYIKTNFFVKIPNLTQRFGYHDYFYSITQWFPKPAVFDEKGWHPISNLAIGEFYSEFGNYDVNITLRDDFIVAATGSLTSTKELERLENYAKLCKNNSTPQSYGSSKKLKTINFFEKNIHDFAWFASPNFIVNKDIIKLEQYNKTVNCWTFYDKQKYNLWSESVEYVKKSIDFFTKNIGEYPYSNCTAVENLKPSNGGMEYPTITLVDAYSKFDLEGIIAHEIAHNWFYGILANNERDNPWIDEGFTSFYEYKYFENYYPNLTFDQMVFKKNINIYNWNTLPQNFYPEVLYNYLISENIAQNPNLNSEKFSFINYYSMVYKKPILAISTLEEYLGKENFKILIQNFYNTYKFKHITPEIIQDYFISNTSKDITWFFNDLIFSNKQTDYKIKKIKNDSVIIKNKGNTLTPLLLYIEDSLTVYDGFKGKKAFYSGTSTNISIDKNFKTLDYNRNNNYYNKSYLTNRNPIKISFANIVDNPLITEIPILPVVAYNCTDGFMLGSIFYTSPIPKKQFEYQLIPMWAFGSETVTGLGNISLFFHPQNNFIREIELFTSGRRFSINKENSDIYHRISSGIKIKFKTDLSKQYISEIILRNIYSTDYYQNNFKNFQQIKYTFSNLRVVNPYSYYLNVERGLGFIKSSIEIETKIHYNYKLKGLKLRFFAGKFLYNSNKYYGNYNFRLSGNIGSQDYLYDYLYIGRNEDIRSKPESFFAHQFVKNDGGFTLYSAYGQTNKWLLALNLDSNTPIKNFDLFINVGMCPDITKPKTYYECGVKISLFKDIINIYFPITGTKEIWDNSNNFYTKNYIQKVRFTLSLEKINLLNYRDKPFLLF